MVAPELSPLPRLFTGPGIVAVISAPEEPVGLVARPVWSQLFLERLLVELQLAALGACFLRLDFGPTLPACLQNHPARVDPTRFESSTCSRNAPSLANRPRCLPMPAACKQRK